MVKSKFFVLAVSILLILAGMLHSQQTIDQRITEIEKKLAGATGKERMELLIQAAETYDTNSPEKILQYGMEALTLAQNLQDRAGEINSQCYIGIGYTLQNKYDSAREYLQAALDGAEKANNKGLMARSSLGLGNLCIKVSDYGKAMDYSQKALQLWEKTGQRAGMARAMNCIGMVLRIQGKYDQALEHYQRAFKINEEIGDQSGRAASLRNIGIIYHLKNKYDQALEYFQKSLQLYEEIGDKKGSISCLNNFGVSYKNIGKYDQALEYYHKALKKLEEAVDKSGSASVLNNIGIIYNNLGKNEKALEYYQRTLGIDEEIGDKSGIGSDLINIGAIYYKMQKYDQALEYYQRALKIKTETGEKNEIFDSLSDIGMVYMEKGKYDQALEYYHKALKIEKEIGKKTGKAQSLNAIGCCYKKMQKFLLSERYLNQSLQIAIEINDIVLIVENYRNLSELFEAKKDVERAFHYYKLFHEENQKLFNENSNKKIIELEAKYDAEKKDKEIKQTKYEAEKKDKEIEIQKIKLQKQILLRNSFFVGFILIAAIFALLFKKYLYFFAFWKKEKYIGRYRLLDVIGSGGMSVVYRAHSIKEKSEKVAVKILKEELSGDDSIVRRFKLEGVIIDKLDHPNIVRVHERGEDRKRLFIAMEYLDGKSLAEKIARESPIDLATCTHIMAQLADALSQIHARKIIHRDLKPANVILISRDGDAHFVKLLDFGLARTRLQSTLTKTGELLGTIGYMSPEQLLDQEVTTASDIYSLGVIFYESACGRRAFAADNEIQIIKRILDEMPAEPRSLRPEIPEEMNALILRMMEKDPGRRPSLADFIENLHRFS